MTVDLAPAPGPDGPAAVAPTTLPTLPTLPTLESVRAAATVVRAVLDPTPLVPAPALGPVAAGVLLKRDDVLPTGSFKVRGGVHLAATLSGVERGRGLVTASTGNHAQSVAWAARAAGTRATVVVPTFAPTCKTDAVSRLGATVVRHGGSLGEAAAHARTLAGAWVDPTDPRIVLGHATAYLELLEQAAARGVRLDAVYVPVGSGTGAVGACVVRDALSPGTRVVGVQSQAAPAAHRAWRSGRPARAESSTRASGLATSASYESTQRVLRDRLDDFLLVPDDDIDLAARLLLTEGHVLVEGAGAAALAGLLADPARRADDLAAVACTGANASPDDVARLLA